MIRLKSSNDRSPAKFARLGGLVILITFAGFGGWAMVAKIDSAIIAPGEVTTVDPGHRLQHLEGGIVQAVLVHEGSEVAEGDVVVRMKRLPYEAKLQTLVDRQEVTRARIERLRAERDRRSELAFAPDLPEEIALRETVIFDERQRILATTLEILDQQLSQIREEVTGLLSQQSALQERLTLQADMLARMEEGRERGVIEANRVVGQHDTVIQIRAILGQVVSDIATARMRALAIESEAQQTVQQFTERAASELSDAEELFRELENEISVLRDQLERTVMQAPVSGRVQNLAVAANDVLQPGMVLMEITPRDPDLIVSTRISPLDVEAITIGQKAEIRFRGYDMRRLQPSEGHVVSLSGNLVGEGEGAHYLARVELDESTVPDEIQASLSLGMPVDVYALRDRRSVARYLIDPIRDVIWRSLREE